MLERQTEENEEHKMKNGKNPLEIVFLEVVIKNEKTREMERIFAKIAK